MPSLAVSNTYVAGASITAAGQNQNDADIVNYINARNNGSTNWDAVNGLASTITGNQTVTGNATVTGTLTVGGALGGVIPAGAVTMFGAASAPTGWLLCDGSAVSRTTYSVLFGVIGTTYGSGDASTTFNVPDMQGVFPKGAGTTARSAGKDSSGNFYAGVLGTYSTDQMQGHTHIARLLGSGTTNLFPTANTGSIANNSLAMSNGADIGSPNAAAIAGPYTDSGNGTPRTGHTSEPQSLGMAFIIKT